MVSRQIEFYRVYSVAEHTFKPEEACKRINKLLWRVESPSRYDHLTEALALAVWMDVDEQGQEILSQPPRLCIGFARRDEIPEVELLGNLSEIPLAENENLLEKTHVVFFERNIVGIELNVKGPRAAHLARYLKQKLDLPFLSFERLYGSQVLQQIDKLDDLTTIRAKADQRSLYDAAEGNSSLPSVMQAALEQLQKDGLEVGHIDIRVKARLRRNLGNSAKDYMKAQWRDPAFRNNIKHLHVEGHDAETGKLIDKNLLAKKLGMRADVEAKLNHRRAVDSKDMFLEIRKAFTQLKDELYTAVSLS